MNHKERKRQLEIDICKLIEVYHHETGFSVTYIEPVYVQGSKSLNGKWVNGNHLVGVKVTAEV